MPFPRHDRIRGIAATVVVLAAALFTRAPIEFALNPTTGPATGLAALLLAAGGAAGLRRALRTLLAEATAAADRAEVLPWVVLYALLATTGLAFALGSANLAGPPWTLLPAGAAAAACLGVVVTERIGLREGLVSLPLLLAFGLGAAAGVGADPRYLQALLLSDVIVVPLVVALLPRPGRPNLGWYVAAGGCGLAGAALVVVGSAAAVALVALSTLTLLRLHPPAPDR